MKPNAPAASLDVAKASAGLSLETEETAPAGELPAPESKRRRLVGGAVALAPLVLTLRSGGVAAASCTGVRAIVSTNGAGKITQSTGPVAEGDVCVAPNTLSACGSDSTRVETKKILTTQNTAEVVKWNGEGDSGLSCGNLSQFQNQSSVAILSSTAASSLGFVPDQSAGLRTKR